MLFVDPVGWSFSAVGTRPRFVFMALSVVALQLLLVHVAVTGGWFPATGLALMMGMTQVMCLVAMRRLLPAAARSEDAPSPAR